MLGVSGRNCHLFTNIKIENVFIHNLKSWFLSYSLHFFLASLGEYEKLRIRLVGCKERRTLTLSFNKKKTNLELCLTSANLFLSKDCSAWRVIWSAEIQTWFIITYSQCRKSIIAIKHCIQNQEIWAKLCVRNLLLFPWGKSS